MSKFKKKRGGGQPAISTASLPDIIFMLLFFFMVVTVLKQSELKVEVTLPEATQLEKMQNKSTVSYFYIGPPKEAINGTAPRLQLNDRFATVDDIPIFLEREKVRVPAQLHDRMTASLRVDKDVTMGIVSDVKTALRKNNQLRLNYSAQPRGDGGYNLD